MADNTTVKDMGILAKIAYSDQMSRILHCG